MSRHSGWFRLAGTGLVLAASVVMIAGSGAVAAPSRPVSSRVGLGWSIAEYSAASTPQAPHQFTGKTTLYLVNPQGRKFAFFSWPASSGGPNTYSLLDWSADGRRVLVENFSNGFEQISVVTGKVISKFKLPGDAAAVGYTGPADQSILAMANYSQDSNSARIYDLTGKLVKILTRSGPPLGAIGSPDGKTAIVSADKGLVQVTNSGRVVRRLTTPVAVTGCAPRRWWNTTTVLASCNAVHGSFLPRLWLFPVSGRTATALTAPRSEHGPDLGDIGGWKLTSGLYVQALALSRCLDDYIAIQSRNGAVHQVTIPGAHAPNDRVIAGQGARLLVQADNGGCSGGTSLAWFDPGTKKVTWVIRPPKNVQGLLSAVPFGGPLTENAFGLSQASAASGARTATPSV